MAVDLIRKNKKVTLINPNNVNQIDTSDPSRGLSPYTFSKYNEIKASTNYTEVLGHVESVHKKENHYTLQLKDGREIKTDQSPICATGFSLVQEPIKSLIKLRHDGYPLLDDDTDEFHGHSNIYLSGPTVRHDNHIFCFIYKFRQRFGVIAEDILNKEMYNLNGIAKLVKDWKQNGMYLSDVSCCNEECVC